MATDLPIRCRCGALRGVASGLTPRSVTRLVCHCTDCQAFAHYLDQADLVLDRHGGTEICQVSPRTIRFDAGADRLACVRLTDKGPYRWYATCCRSPVGNSLPGLGVVGLIRPTVEAGGARLGPIRARIFGRDAVGDAESLDAADRIPPRLMLRVLRKLLLRRLRGDHRHSPFHDPRTGRAIVPPDGLSRSKRQALDRQRAAWRAGGHRFD